MDSTTIVESILIRSTLDQINADLMAPNQWPKHV